MPDDARSDTSLDRLRVLELQDTPRAKLLTHRWLYYATKQNDGLDVDYDGYSHTPGFGYLQERMRGLGYVPAVNSAIPFGLKRPTCHTLSVGHIVDTYTALLLGEGRQPAIRVVSDDESTDLLNALMQHCEAWSSLAETRKIAGATGAAAALPEIKDGELSIRTLRPENLYAEWTDKAGWIPSRVIEQKKVLIEDLDADTGKVVTIQVWRTRAWDETYTYVYKDKVIEADDGSDGGEERAQKPDKRIEQSEPPIPHGAGRCPVVWFQNTKDSDQPVGEPDCEPVFETIDQIDKSQSMIVRGSRANTDPTLVRKDSPRLLKKWGATAKGYGAVIKVSPQGDAKLLETQGSSITTAWETVDRLNAQVAKRTGVIQPDPENSGAYQSGVALQLLWNTQHSRAAEHRTPLSVGMKQLFKVILTQLRTFSTKSIGAEGEGIEVPPRETRDEETAETTFDEHSIGDGAAIVLDWPGFHEATPQDLLTTASALNTATGGLPSMSQETAVAHMTKHAQTNTDKGEELERIRGERDLKVSEFDESMRPDVEGLAEAELDENGDPIEVELDEDGKPNTGTTDQVQHEAMNGIQVKTLGDVFARTGADLTPIASKFTITEGFPNTKDREAELDLALASQVAEADKNAAKGEAIAGGDSLGRPITRGNPKPAADVPAPREPEDTGEQDEAE